MLLCAFFVSFSGHHVSAQEYVSDAPAVDILPAKSINGDPIAVEDEDMTHTPLRLTPDKSELLRLEEEASTILVGNPAHLSVLAESSKLLVFIPRQAGATHVTVLDSQGKTIMQRHVIVASPKQKYLRIRKSCAGSDDESCRQTQVYYCPDMCHAIAPAAEESDAPAAPEQEQDEGLYGSQGNSAPADE